MLDPELKQDQWTDRIIQHDILSNSVQKTQRHQVVQEYVYQDMVLCGDHTPLAALQQIPEFSLKNRVLLASYIKTGNSWIQEIAWLVANEADTEKASQIPTMARIPFIDLRNPETGRLILDEIKGLQQSGIVKSHLPAQFFSRQLQDDNVKVIVMIRNPKDVCVSAYHFYRMNYHLGNFKGSWNMFFEEIVAPNRMVYGDYFKWYISWFEAKNQSKILLVKYEDLHKDLAGQVERVAKFLEKELTKDQVDLIANHCTFGAMKSNPMTNYSYIPKKWFNYDISPFMRQGKVGDWRDYFNEEQSRAIDERYKKEFGPYGVTLDFEL